MKNVSAWKTVSVHHVHDEQEGASSSSPRNGQGSPISGSLERRAAVGTVQEGLKNRCSLTDLAK